MTRALAALAAALVLAGPAGAHGPTPHPPTSEEARAALFDPRRALEYSQDAIGREVGDHRFVSRDDRAVRLAEYRGKPLVVSLIYTSCVHTCPLIVQNLRRAVETAEAALGAASFAVATVGFDARADTPARLRLYARQQGIDRPDWQFLSADAATVERLAADLGFLFVASPAGFDHLAQVSVLDGAGRVYRQIYGEEVPVQALVEPLKELVLGRPAAASLLDGLIARVRFICTVYDPQQGRYRFSYAIFLGLGIGLLSMVATATVLVRAWLRHVRA